MTPKERASVPDFAWIQTSPLLNGVQVGKYGASADRCGVTVSEARGFGLVLIFARRGQWRASIDAARKYFGVDAPQRPLAVSSNSATLIWSGPGQFYALYPQVDGPQPLHALREIFVDSASVSDQSDGRGLIRISGTQARATLSKLSSIDLGATVFPIGASAATSIEHTNVNLWRDTDAADGSPVFNILVFTSFANSIWHAVVDSAAEFGVEFAGSYHLGKDWPAAGSVDRR
jgi:heterotetrameric sarcosine oxidase gamma subunit